MSSEPKVSNASSKALLRRPVFWFYGSASIAFAIKDNAFSYLLLMYCNQVLGLPGYLAARAMALALVWDALFDMLIGHLSDKTNSRLGRRHPYMYASLFILPPSFYALFNPVVALSPSTPHHTFMYILAITIIVRTGTALFEIPSAAQLPDLEQDYERRNEWYAMRFFFGWFGGASMHVINFTYWVGVHGNTSPIGFSLFARHGAVLMFLVILISSLGTQKMFSGMPSQSKSFRLSEFRLGAWQAFQSIFQSIGNKNFQALFVYGITTGVSGGLSSSLTLYLMNYFFAFSSAQIAFSTTAFLISPVVACSMAPVVGSYLGKRKTAMICTALQVLFSPVPCLMVLLGCWPALGSWASLYAYSAHLVFMGLLFITTGVMTDSMMADVVEDGEVSTNQRSEGLYFAARGFAGKVISGGGVMFAGSIVTMVGLDNVRSAAEMTFQKRLDLARFFLPLSSLLHVLGLFALSRYNIGRTEHNANLAKLSERKKQALGDSKALPSHEVHAGADEVEQGTRRRPTREDVNYERSIKEIPLPI